MSSIFDAKRIYNDTTYYPCFNIGEKTQYYIIKFNFSGEANFYVKPIDSFDILIDIGRINGSSFTSFGKVADSKGTGWDVLITMDVTKDIEYCIKVYAFGTVTKALSYKLRCKNYVADNQLKDLGWYGVNEKMVKQLNDAISKYDINTYERICHFLGQCKHESDRGRGLIEYGSKSYFDQYEPGTPKGNDVGNIYAGDGYKFRGSGYIHLTGRYNYQQFANHINDQNVMLGAEYVAEHYGWETAGWFWDTKNINSKITDVSNSTIEKVTKKINPGLNGLSERKTFTKDCESVFN